MDTFLRAFATFATTYIILWIRPRLHIEDTELLAQFRVLVEMAIAFVMSGLVTAVAWLATTGKAYWERQIKARLTNRLIAEAHMENPNVDLKKIITDKLVAEAALDPASPISVPAGETPESLERKIEAAGRVGATEVVVPLEAKP